MADKAKPGSDIYRRSKWKLIVASTIAAIIGALVTSNFMHLFVSDNGFHVSSKLFEDLGLEGIVLFRQHDRDGDGFLSLDEFEPIAHVVKEVNVSIMKAVAGSDRIVPHVKLQHFRK